MDKFSVVGYYRITLENGEVIFTDRLATDTETEETVAHGVECTFNTSVASVEYFAVTE